MPITILDVAIFRGARKNEDGSIDGGEFMNEKVRLVSVVYQ